MQIEAIRSVFFFAVFLLALPSIAYAAGHIQPTGETEGEASQLIVWYDQSQTLTDFNTFSLFQVTNGSLDTPVNIHVQIFADDVSDSTDRCQEHDFNDTLTPTDTIVYIIGSLDTPFDGCPTCTRGGDNDHDSIAIDVDGTRGFIVVTAVNQATLPRLAIAHNHLFGSIFVVEGVGDDFAHSMPAMGRVAVNFTTGAPLADGAFLNGVSTGFTLLQPIFLYAAFHDLLIGAGDPNNVVSITFSDTYSDTNGEYTPTPSTVTWSPIMFDQFEVGTACQQHATTCFVTMGLNEDWGTDIDDIGGYTDVPLCPAVSTPGNFFDGGWYRIFVSDLSGLENHLGALGLSDNDEAIARWMHGE